MTEADHLSPGVYEPRKKAHSELRQRATSTHRSSDADSRDACDASSIIDPAPSLQQSLRDDDRSLSIISTGPQCANEKISDSHESSPWSRKIILALDGGGVRGYSSLLILRELMLKIETLERQDGTTTSSSDYPWNNEHFNQSDNKFYPHHYFDYVAGTSTGGLSAIMLGRLRMSVDEAIAEYKGYGNSVFGRPRWFHEKSLLFLPRSKYATRKTRKAIQAVIVRRLGITHPTLTLRDRIYEPFSVHEYRWPRCRTMAVAFSKDHEEGTELLYLFRSYDHYLARDASPEQRKHGAMNPGPAYSGPIWEVARATSAAPRYFEAIKLNGRKFLDGGMGANNPGLIAFKEVRKLHDKPPDLLVSIGTGVKKPRAEKKPKRERYRDYFEYLKRTDTTGRKQFFKKWFELVDFVKDFASDSEGIERNVHDFACETNTFYKRFNVEDELGHVLLDEWKPPRTGADTLSRIEQATRQYLNDADVQVSLEETAKKLVSLRQERAMTERWEQFGTDYVYNCTKDRCKNIPQDWRERSEFRKHLVEEHREVSPNLERLVDKGRVKSWSKSLEPRTSGDGHTPQSRGTNGRPKVIEYLWPKGSGLPQSAGQTNVPSSSGESR